MKSKGKIEFGDFQTPPALAREACELLARRSLQPASIVEPTCGTGNFLIAALDQFGQAEKSIGVEINSLYVNAVTSALQRRPRAGEIRVIHKSFFDVDWRALLGPLPEPLLVLGNPPWVTNAELGVLGSSNLPEKTNFQKRSGLDAITGKSNFDISEWMLIRILEWLDGRNGTMAMLCKTAVARKVLMHAWKNDLRLERSEMYLVDASQHFDASVDACFLVCHSSASTHNHDCSDHDCSVYGHIGDHKPAHTIGYREGHLVSEVPLYERWKHLQGCELSRWRSGVKHDCAKVMELRKEGDGYRNGLGELVDLEDDYLFPMLKSSDLANGRVAQPQRWMLVTQRAVGDETTNIRRHAPKTWSYLESHAQRLDGRASSIYKKRPKFSVFGVGPYSFAPWKVAISGFYKSLEFKVVGNVSGKPIMLDDTAYFVACESKQEAECIASLLNSGAAQEFLRAFIFWDAKRPITVEILRRLDLMALARHLGTESTMGSYVSQKSKSPAEPMPSHCAQGELFGS